MADAGAEQQRIDAGPVLARCRALGFALAGVSDAAPTETGPALRRWLAEGRHGAMDWLERFEPILLDPRRLLPDVRAIVCVADRYHDGRRDRRPGPGERARGFVARYARGTDYHRTMRRRLETLAAELARDHPGHAFRVCVDTAPLLEREYAQRAGLGAIGKHTLLLERGLGSWLLLGEIATTLPLAVSAPSRPDPCGGCTRCIDACPTGAIAPWSVDATRCISYLTIEHRGAIDPALHEGIGDWIFGCDVCQEVCPHGARTRRSGRAPTHPDYAPRRDGFDLLEVLGWTEDDRRAAFTVSALKRAKLFMMKRNALIVAGNRLRTTDDPPLRARIAKIAADASEDEIVRETAQIVLARLG